MPRDYIQRSPAKKKSGAKKGNSRSASRNQAPAPKAPWFMLVLAVVLVTGFIYGLIKINGSAGQAENPPAKIQLDQTPAPKNNKGSKPLPPKPKERWTFIEELENKEVQVELPEQPKTTRPYLMQCGSFRAKSQAEELKVRIAFQGLESEVRRAEGKSGIWHKVVLGPYPTKREAERDRHILQRGNIQGCQIWFW